MLVNEVRAQEIEFKSKIKVRLDMLHCQQSLIITEDIELIKTASTILEKETETGETNG